MTKRVSVRRITPTTTPDPKYEWIPDERPKGNFRIGEDGGSSHDKADCLIGLLIEGV